MTNFVIFRLLAEVFLESLSKLLSSSAKDCFDRRKVLSKREVFFWKNFGVGAEKFLIFAQKLPARLPNVWSINPEEHFEENNDEKKKQFLDPFQTLSEIRWHIRPKNFWLPSLNSKLHIQEIKFYQISCCSMTHFVTFRLLAEIFPESWSKLLSLSAEDRFEKKKFFRTKKCFF